MTRKFHEIAFTAEVLAAQAEGYGRARPVEGIGPEDELGGVERDFIAARDSFYLATVSSTGWPHLQHRGGETGFLRLLDARRLAFADLSGNRQLVSTGNIRGESRVALFLMDYPGRRRLKILGRAEIRPADDPDLLREFGADRPAGTERFIVIEIVAHDWNCPKHIRPRFSAAEVADHTARLRQRIAALEDEIAGLRAAGPGRSGRDRDEN